MFPRLEELPDQLLLEQSAEGSEAAFNVLFRRYFNKLYLYTLSFTKDDVIAEELVMDVMLRLWMKQGDITVQDSLSPYLFRAVKNALINHWRKKAVQTSTLEVNYSDARSADHDLLSSELDSFYNRQLEALSPQRKKVFELSRHENMSYPQIANALNLSVKTVEHHISASLSAFRKNLKSLSDATILLIILFHFF